jgi:hypothetical protein
VRRLYQIALGISDDGLLTMTGSGTPAQASRANCDRRGFTANRLASRKRLIIEGRRIWEETPWRFQTDPSREWTA